MSDDYKVGSPFLNDIYRYEHKGEERFLVPRKRRITIGSSRRMQQQYVT